jgi:hypothetical protein
MREPLIMSLGESPEELLPMSSHPVIKLKTVAWRVTARRVIRQVGKLEWESSRKALGESMDEFFGKRQSSRHVTRTVASYVEPPSDRSLCELLTI